MTPILDFGMAEVDTTVSQVFTIYNDGAGALHVEGMVVEGSDAFTFAPGQADADPLVEVDPTQGFVVAAGGARQIALTFEPAEHVGYAGHLTLVTNDPRAPWVRVPLEGLRADPWLQIEPLALDLGVVGVPCSVAGEITLRNRGDAPLHIDEVTVQADPAFQVASDAFPLVLDPGESTSLSVTYMSEVHGASEGRLTVVSDSPRGTVWADLQAHGVMSDWHVERFAQDPDRYGMLLVVDRSDVSADVEKALQDALPDFLDALVDEASDWSLGVVTADSGCVNDRVFDEVTESLYLDVIMAASGDGGAHSQALLELAERALSQAAPGRCNEGLLDPNAPLHVVVVSDSDDSSAVDVDALVSDMWGAFYDPDLLTISAVYDPAGNCGPAGERYEHARALTGGMVIDLCEQGWSSNLALAPSFASPNQERFFTLQGDPMPETLRVLVNGASQNGWSFDEVRNRIRFDVAPPPGADITVRYAGRGACD